MTTDVNRYYPFIVAIKTREAITTDTYFSIDISSVICVGAANNEIDFTGFRKLTIISVCIHVCL